MGTGTKESTKDHRSAARGTRVPVSALSPSRGVTTVKLTSYSVSSSMLMQIVMLIRSCEGKDNSCTSFSICHLANSGEMVAVTLLLCPH